MRTVGSSSARATLGNYFNKRLINTSKFGVSISIRKLYPAQFL